VLHSGLVACVSILQISPQWGEVFYLQHDGSIGGFLCKKEVAFLAAGSGECGGWVERNEEGSMSRV
jgi:hypothetical protein